MSTIHFCTKRDKDHKGTTGCGITGNLINPWLADWANPYSGRCFVSGSPGKVTCLKCKGTEQFRKRSALNPHSKVRPESDNIESHHCE